MNIRELNEMVKNNQKEELEKTIKEIENNIVCRANEGFNDIDVVTDRSYCMVCYTIDKKMLEPLKDYFINNGYKVEIKEIISPIKCIEKLLKIYEPKYLMVISWKNMNDEIN